MVSRLRRGEQEGEKREKGEVTKSAFDIDTLPEGEEVAPCYAKRGP